jgi:N4-gp56 family major capsid protein
MANITTQFTDGTASDATQSFFNTLLLVRATYALIHQVPVKKYNLARRNGKTMIWRRFESLALAKTPLVEGVAPAGKAKTKTDVSASILQYGDYIEDSDMIFDTQPDPQTTENVELLGQQTGETFDELYRDLFATATQIVYVNGTSTVTVSQIVDQNDLDRAYRLIRVNKARPFSPAIMAGQNVGSGAIMPSYWGLADERLAFDLRHLEGFVKTVDYASKTGTLQGEIGADRNGVRYLISPNGYFLTGATGVTIAATDIKNTGGFADIYSLFIVGQEAVGGVSLSNGNGGIIRHGLGSAGTADALDQRATVGWKKYDTRVVLNQNFMVEVQTGVSL